MFEWVADSRRTVTEYIGDARRHSGFKPPREVVDEVPPNGAIQIDELQEFGFEGYQESPSAWVDNWIVRAKSFMLEVL